MCIIAVFKAGVKVNKNDLMNCFENNPDGAGFMYQERKHNRVVIKKGFMSFDKFWKEFKDLPWNVDRVAHFRIATSGKVDIGCCHPFPVTNDLKEMKKPVHATKLAVAHNGIIDFTTPADKLKSYFSDTMAFIANYVYPMKDFIFHDTLGDLIQVATSSKFAIMSPREIKMIGDFKECDGIYYSNSTYLNYYNYTGGCYGWADYNDYGFGSSEYDNSPPFRIAFSLYNDKYNWDYAEEIAKALEDEGIEIGDYWLGKNCGIYIVNKLPLNTRVGECYWWRIWDKTADMYQPKAIS